MSLSRKKRNGLLLCTSGVLCIVLPQLAKRSLDKKVQSELAEAASDSFGVPISLGHASVGLTGTLEVRDVRVGDVFRAKRVIARVARKMGSSHLAANEILVDSPQLDLKVFSDGSTNLDTFLRKKSKNKDDLIPAKKRKSKIERIHLVNGSMHLQIEDKGDVWSNDIEVLVQGDAVHAILGPSKFDMHAGSWHAAGQVPRAALDYLRGGGGLQRLLADGGEFQVEGPGGKAMVTDLVLSNQIGDSDWKLTARAGIDRPTGSFELQINPRLGGYTLEFEADKAPLPLLGPWLPSAVLPKETLVSGHGSIATAGDITADLQLQFQQFYLSHDDLAKRPLRFDMGLHAEGRIHHDGAARYIDTKIHSLQVGALDLSGQASAQWNSEASVPHSAKVDLQLAEVDCDVALSALPPGLRPHLAGLDLRGKLKSSIELTMSKASRAGTTISVSSGIDACKVVADPPAADTLALRGPYQYQTPDGRTRVLSETSQDFSSIKSLPSYVPLAFVVAEDARFFDHKGFDLHQIENSLAIDMENARFVRGGSTISQQLIKNIFLHRKRSLARKLQEAILTWRLERNLSKNRILELYLNIIELGDNHTYGIAEASQRWFGIPAKDLSVLQTAFLAALTPEPTSMSARIRASGTLDPVSKSRVAIILRVMKRGNVISQSQFWKAMHQDLHFTSAAVASKTP